MKKGVLSGVLNGDKRTGLDIHILKGVGLVREVFEGRFEGRRVRGRRRRGLLDGLKNGGNYVDLKQPPTQAWYEVVKRQLDFVFYLNYFTNWETFN